MYILRAGELKDGKEYLNRSDDLVVVEKNRHTLDYTAIVVYGKKKGLTYAVDKFGKALGKKGKSLDIYIEPVRYVYHSGEPDLTKPEEYIPPTLWDKVQDAILMGLVLIMLIVLGISLVICFMINPPSAFGMLILLLILL